MRGFAKQAVLMAAMGSVTAPVIGYANGVYTAAMFQIGASLQWQRDGVDIAGATANTYAKVSADHGKVIRLKQTFGATALYSNVLFAASAESNTYDNVTATRTAIFSAARKLRADYSGPCMQVRRSSDSTLEDIGFTAEGLLDESALLDFVGSGNGFIRTWYDQSGNGRNATQSVNSSQPRIVSSGVIESLNGLPALYFGGGVWYLLIDDHRASFTDKWAVAAVINTPSGGGSAQRIFDARQTTGDNGGAQIFSIEATDKMAIQTDPASPGGRPTATSAATVTGALLSALGQYDQTNGGKLTTNGAVATVAAASATNLVWGASQPDWTIGASFTASEALKGYMPEFVLFNSSPDTTDQATILDGQDVFYSRAGDIIALTAATLSDSTAYPGHAKLSLVGTYTATIAALEYCIFSSTGDLLADWTALPDATGGTIAATIDNLPDNYQGLALVVKVRDAAEPATNASKGTKTVGYYEPVLATILGMNTDEAYNYSHSDIVRNRCSTGRWFYRNSGSGATLEITAFNAAGWPNDPIPGGYDQIYCLIFESGKESMRTGIWEVVPSVACTMGFAALTNATPGAITSTSALLETGATGVFSAGVVFSGAGVTAALAADGFSATCWLQSDTLPATDLVAPQAAADWAASQFGPNGFVWRDMKYSATEDAGATPNYRRWYTPEFAASFQRQTGAHLWHTIPWSEDIEATTRPFLEHWRDNTPSTALLYGEVDNELWNTGYGTQFNKMAVAAFNAGHWAEGTIPDGVTVADALSDVSTTTGETSRDFEPGEWFYCRSGVSGGATHQTVLVEVTSGTTVLTGAIVPITGAANGFTVRAVFSSVNNTNQRYLTALQIAYAQLGHEILGDRFISVRGIGPNDSAANIVAWLTYQNGHLYIDHYANTGYSGQKVAYASLPWAASHTSDFAAFKAGWIAHRRTNTDAMITNRVTTKHAVRTLLRALGISADQCPTMIFYETGDHNTIGAVPSGDRAGVVAAIILCKQSAEEYDEVMHHLSEMDAQLGGVNGLFTSVEIPFYNTGPDQAQGFGWLMNQRGGRTDEQAYDALLAFAAAL
jgi:hypothetical protein